MADIFQQSDAKRLLKDKYILFLGDSNVRALYKDLVWLLNSNTLIDDHVLRRKLEYSFLGDKLLARSELNKEREYQEVREFEKFGARLGFYFLTRCFNDGVENLIRSFQDDLAPHVIYINSCLWDISRWGPRGVTMYKENLLKLMRLFKQCLPAETLVIWGTALPISSKIRSGFLIKQIEFLKHLLRFEVMEANTFARQVVVNYGYDVLDLHYHMRMQIHRRAKDGIHYKSVPVRHQTNLILTHIALAWDLDLPGNVTNSLLDERITMPRSEVISVLDEKVPLVLSQLNCITASCSEANLEDYKPRKKIQSKSKGQETNFNQRRNNYAMNESVHYNYRNTGHNNGRNRYNTRNNRQRPY